VKILLTGASSFTGFWFAGRLAEAGHEVVATLRGAPGDYAGVRAQRVALLGRWAEVVPNCAFGDDAFLELIAGREFDVLCHHAAEAGAYRSDDFDVAAAVAANTLNLRRVLAAMRERGLKAVVATGSVFEPDEGCGPAPRRAFSPYGVSKRLTFEVLRYWGDVVGAPVSKFVIANPFGPFEEARFVTHAVETWAKGEAVEVKTPNYLRDNIHVDLLALAYANFVQEAAAGRAARRLGPCGYMETQGAFAQRLERELGRRLGLDARVVLAEQKAFAEPQARINTDVIDGAALGWGEDKAWDALAGFYRGRGFAAAPRPAAVAEPPPPPPPAAPALDLRGAVDIATRTHISGWLTDKFGANPRFLKVTVNGVEHGAMRADLFRRDLSDVKISNGYSGYRFAFATALDPLQDHVVKVEDRDSGRSFGPPPIVYNRIVGGPDSPFAGDRDFEAVNVGSASYEGGRIQLLLELFGGAAGFSLPESADATFELLHKAQNRHRYYDALGIEAMRVSFAVKPHDGVKTVTFSYPEAARLDDGGQLVCANVIPAAPPAYLNDLAKENMERVSGPGEFAGRFAACGLATAYRIDRLVRLHFGRGLADCGRCLDWGAGPGRVALPMARTVAPGLELTAIDIDGFNVAFGKRHFPDIDYAEAPFMPPLPYPDATFGAIYGVSVFTHLTESVQFAWLAELRRVAKPGAPVVVSVHNDYAAINCALGSPEVVTEIEKRGISDAVYDGNLAALHPGDLDEGVRDPENLHLRQRRHPGFRSDAGEVAQAGKARWPLKAPRRRSSPS